MKLRVAAKSARPPDFSAARTLATEAWRMPDGTVWSYSHVVDGGRWLELPGVGVFLLGDRADEITAFPEAGIGDDELQDAFRRVVVPIAFQAQGGEVLHASAVYHPLGVIAFCADSHGGKSTLAYAMSRRGHRMWADDAVAIDFSADSIAAVALPFTLRLRPAAARFFFGTERTADHEPTRGGEDYGRTPKGPVSLAAVFFLERLLGSDAGPPEVARMAPAAAFTRVLPQAFCFTLQDVERKGLMMRQYLCLSASVPFFRLRMAAGLERMDEVAECIELELANSVTWVRG